MRSSFVEVANPLDDDDLWLQRISKRCCHTHSSLNVPMNDSVTPFCSGVCGRINS